MDEAPATESETLPTRQATISDNQLRLFEEIWIETVHRVIPITNVDQIASEWLVLSNMFERYRAEAYDRYRLHAK